MGHENVGSGLGWVNRIRLPSLALAAVLAACGDAARADDPSDKLLCADADRLAEEYLVDLRLSVDKIDPAFRASLDGRNIAYSLTRRGGRQQVEIILENVRPFAILPPTEPLVENLPIEKISVLTDRRSRITRPWQIDEHTVIAADLAYDIEHEVAGDLSATGRLDPSLVARKLPDYVIAALYADTFSGFTGVVLERKPEAGMAPHRIYAIAGSRVFHNPDLRTWASGLTMARAQVVSGAALRMIRDAADYAQAGAGGGEVFVTGQSQGGLSSQGFGYLLQLLLDAAHRPHHLVHVVSWGAAGAAESLVRMVRQHQEGRGRGFLPELERHWSFVDRDHAAESALWEQISAAWAEVPPDAVLDHIFATARRMRVVGYYFEIDLFARGGTFIGVPMVFPTALVVPDRCELLVAERIADTTAGTFGIALESHFLNGYQRAVKRGAVGLAWPAKPKKWSWVVDLLPAAEAVGDVWLTNIYLGRLGGSERNWAHCFAAGRWLTDENRWCERPFWPGCSGESFATGGERHRSSKVGSWCLIADGGGSSLDAPHYAGR